MAKQDTYQPPTLAELLRGGHHSLAELAQLSGKDRAQVARFLQRARARRLFAERWHPRGFTVYSAHARPKGIPRPVQLALFAAACLIGACEVAEPAFACEHGDTLVHSAQAGEIVGAWKCDELGRWVR